MRKTLRFILALACPLFLSLTSVQAQANYEGDWEGAIELPGMQLAITIHLTFVQNTWSGTLDIPLQQVKGMKLAELVIDGKKAQFKLPEVPGKASFSGTFDEQAAILAGTFMQSGQFLPTKVTKISATKLLENQIQTQSKLERFRHLVDSLRIKQNTPGLAIGMVKDGKTILLDGFGYRDLENKLPATANTQFAIGSSSKAFTSLCLGIMADRDQLDWEKPIVQYLPDFKLYDAFATQSMNALDLLSHRSGLPRHDLMWYGSNFSRKEIFERLQFLPPNKPLRTTWQYNNLMFMTAGYMVERVTGTSWEKYVETEIFQPLGMKNSNTSVAGLTKYKEAAKAYSLEEKHNVLLPYRNLDAIGPAGSINSTATDMLQWVRLHLSDGKLGDIRIVSDRELKRLHTPQMLMLDAMFVTSPELTDPSYALGWFVYRQKGIRIVEHGGNIDGFTALVYLVPEKDFGLVILCNQNTSTVPSTLARYATDLFLDLEYTDWATRNFGRTQEVDATQGDKKQVPAKILNTKASQNLEAYTGVFEHPGYGKIEIEKTGDKLRLHFNSFYLSMEHWHYDVFRATDTLLGISFMINFQTDNNGQIYQLSTTPDPLSADIHFVKLAPDRLSDPIFLQQLAGKYKIETLDISLTVETNQSKLILIVPNQPPYTLLPDADLRFKLKDANGFSVLFILDEKGKVTGLHLDQPNANFLAKKL
jgi:CubicO group peptidase (beta-lactamase class C family)